MKRVFQVIVAIVTGVLVGGAVNMGIIMISGSIIAPPEGAITTTMEGLKESLHLFEPKHFIMPFLSHSLGTLIGAFLAALISPVKKLRFALGIGTWFLIGGIINIIILPSPTWYSLIDIVGAYIPMAFIGGKLSIMLQSKIK